MACQPRSSLGYAAQNPATRPLQRYRSTDMKSYSNEFLGISIGIPDVWELVSYKHCHVDPRYFQVRDDDIPDKPHSSKFLFVAGCLGFAKHNPAEARQHSRISQPIPRNRIEENRTTAVGCLGFAQHNPARAWSPQTSANHSQGMESRGIGLAPPSKNAALDHFQSAARSTSPRRTGLLCK
jgi:hypothetical protein